MIVLPAASIRWIPAGTSTRGPTATTFPLRTTIVARSTAAFPVPSMTRAPTKATSAAEAQTTAASRVNPVLNIAAILCAPPAVTQAAFAGGGAVFAGRGLNSSAGPCVNRIHAPVFAAHSEELLAEPPPNDFDGREHRHLHVPARRHDDDVSRVLSGRAGGGRGLAAG